MEEAETTALRAQLAQTQAALLQARADFALLRGLLDQHAIVSEADVNGCITYVNDRFCEVSGYRRDELIGQNHRAIKSGVHAPEFYEAMWDTIASGRIWQGVVCNRRKDGSHYWVRGTIVPVLDGQGLPQRYLSIRTDITEIIEYEEALRISEERLRRAQAYADIGTWDWDIVTGRLLWSERIAPMFGLPATAETTFQNFIGVVHPDDRQAISAAIDACIGHGRKYLVEHRIVLPDGGVRWMLEQGDVTRDAAGRPLHMLGVVQDITARKEAEEKLRAAMHSLANAQRIARLGSWDIDLKSGELYWSEEIYRIFGRDSRSFTPSHKNFYATVHPADVDLVRQKEEESYRTGIFSVTHRIMRPDGSVRHVHEQGEVYFDAAGQPVRAAGTVQDVTESIERERQLQEAKEEAERANQAKSAFLSSMSHELRTPLNAILGFAQLLQMQQGADADQRENVDEILRAGRHLLELINEVLDLARIEAGRLCVVLEPVRCCALVDECIGLTRTLAEQHGIRLGECPRSLCPVWFSADCRRLKQVIVNLISNAIKYNRPQGSVLLRIARGAAGRVRVEVEDTGFGIVPEKQPGLFEPFERLGADAQGIEGTGIGLIISKRLVEAMGGSIGFTSTPGEGSLFWVELPETGPPQDDAAVPALPPQPVSATAAATLLCIEDNPANLRVVEKLVAARPGWRLLAATAPQQGLELARAHHPDVILLDIKMPGMDGFEVMRRLQADAATSAIPVIAVSANAMEHDLALGEAAGFRHYLPKPLEVPRLLAVLDQLLR